MSAKHEAQRLRFLAYSGPDSQTLPPVGQYSLWLKRMKFHVCVCVWGRRRGGGPTHECYHLAGVHTRGTLLSSDPPPARALEGGVGLVFNADQVLASMCELTAGATHDLAHE